MIVYVYKCRAHGKFEAFSELGNRELPKPCPQCQEKSPRVVTAPTIKLEGVTGHFPTAADRWARIHEQEAKRVN